MISLIVPNMQMSMVVKNAIPMFPSNFKQTLHGSHPFIPTKIFIISTKIRQSFTLSTTSSDILDFPIPYAEPSQDTNTVINQEDDTLIFTEETIKQRSRDIHTLCIRGGISKAIKLLQTLQKAGHEPDTLIASSLVHALCQAKRSLEAHRYLSYALNSHWVPDERTCNVIISKLIDTQSPSETLQTINHIISLKPWFAPSLVNYNKLINSLCKKGMITQAEKCINAMEESGVSPNVISYTTLISGYCENAKFNDACQLFDKMRATGLPCFPNSVTYSIVALGYLNHGMVSEGAGMVNELWREMCRCPRDTNLLAFDNLVRGLCKCGRIEDVLMLAQHMPQWVDAEVAYAGIIDALCENGHVNEGRMVIGIMREKGRIVNKVSYDFVVHGFCRKGMIGEAWEVLEVGFSDGYAPSESTYRFVLEGFLKDGGIDEGKTLLEMMLSKSTLKKLRIYNIFIYAISGLKNSSELLNTMIKMLQNGCTPDIYTLNSVVHGCCKAGQMEEANTILNDMLEGKFCPPDIITFSSIIHGLSNRGQTDEALEILHQMREDGLLPNNFTYNPIIHELCRAGKFDKAFEVMDEMRNHGLSPDKVSFTFVFDGLCKNRKFDKGLEFWYNVVKPSGNHDDYVYASVLRLLCKEGKLREAWDLLNELIEEGFAPGIVVYNVVIHGACKLGSMRDALKIVDLMKGNCLKADIATWQTIKLLTGVKGRKDILDSTEQRKHENV